MTDVDLSEFEALNGRSGGKCMVGLVLKELTPAKRRKVLAALDSPRVQAKAIARWLENNGHSVHRNSVLRHRKRECACDRSE